MSGSFIKQYLQFSSGSEVPICFHRWCIIGGIGALLAKKVHVLHGDSRIFPNQYLMLMGDSGTRKSAAIKRMKRLLMEVGYGQIAFDKTSKEKFLLDLSNDGEEGVGDNGDNILDKNLWGGNEDRVASVAIMADEANDFFGYNNLEFLSTLGTLWDWDSGPYDVRTKTSQSFKIPNPNVNILAGNTQVNFTKAFPPDILGQGFFSRILLVYSQTTGVKITRPKKSDPKEWAEVIGRMRSIWAMNPGEWQITEEAWEAIDFIYQKGDVIEDVRFDSYYNRRFTHLIKLSIITAVSRGLGCVDCASVIEANTYLSYIEGLMPRALGEFGKSRNSDITNKIVGIINKTDGIILREIFAQVSNDLERQSMLGEIMQSLLMAGKIKTAGGSYFPVRKRGIDVSSNVVDLSYLTKEELEVT